MAKEKKKEGLAKGLVEKLETGELTPKEIKEEMKKLELKHATFREIAGGIFILGCARHSCYHRKEEKRREYLLTIVKEEKGVEKEVICYGKGLPLWKADIVCENRIWGNRDLVPFYAFPSREGSDGFCSFAHDISLEFFCDNPPSTCHITLIVSSTSHNGNCHQ